MGGAALGFGREAEAFEAYSTRSNLLGLRLDDFGVAAVQVVDRPTTKGPAVVGDGFIISPMAFARVRIGLGFAPIGLALDRGAHAANGVIMVRCSAIHPVTRMTNASSGLLEIEAWQATDAVAIRAMLQYSYPDQAQFMFGDFEEGEGAAAVVNASTFLDRRRATSGLSRRQPWAPPKMAASSNGAVTSSWS